MISKASTQIRAQTDFTHTYNGYNYKFYVITLGDLPDPYYFNSDVIDYVINTCGKAQRYQIENRSNIRVVDWAQEQTENILNWVFGSVVNAYVATNNLIHDVISSDAYSYAWDFTCTGIDPNYPGSETYGTAYGFEFKGICGDIITITLDSQGDFYGNNPIGNYQIDPDPEPYNWILINQGLDNFYVPDVTYTNLNNLDSPYFDGKSLYFTFYGTNDQVKKYYITNVDDCAFGLSFYGLQNNYYNDYPGIIMFDGKATSSTRHDVYDSVNDSLISSMQYNVNSVKTFTYNNVTYNSYPYFFSLGWINSPYHISINFPGKEFGAFRNISSFNYDVTDILGCVDGSFVSGSVPSMWLQSFSYTVNPDPNPIPEDPIPTTSIPEDPEDPIPDTDPDPVPGITPINPTPPIIRPLPSIVSGNDDLWPSVVELENIEIDLGGYISGLDDYEFPDLSSITSSFSGAIVWVSAIMSTLFNGSDFSILFAVLSSFFIVAALLGLYKWWNHK